QRLRGAADEGVRADGDALGTGRVSGPLDDVVELVAGLLRGDRHRGGAGERVAEHGRGGGATDGGDVERRAGEPGERRRAGHCDGGGVGSVGAYDDRAKHSVSLRESGGPEATSDV